jgi:hypothetical protein
MRIIFGFPAADNAPYPKPLAYSRTVLWNKSKSGKEFVASLARHGYILAKGDRNQFVIIDKAGSVHGLTRIHGATAKIVKRGMADVDPATLPTIAEAKRQARGTRNKTSFRKYSKTQTVRNGITVNQTIRTRSGSQSSRYRCDHQQTIRTCSAIASNTDSTNRKPSI